MSDTCRFMKKNENANAISSAQAVQLDGFFLSKTLKHIVLRLLISHLQCVREARDGCGWGIGRHAGALPARDSAVEYGRSHRLRYPYHIQIEITVSLSPCKL